MPVTSDHRGVSAQYAIGDGKLGPGQSLDLFTLNVQAAKQGESLDGFLQKSEEVAQELFEKFKEGANLSLQEVSLYVLAFLKNKIQMHNTVNPDNQLACAIDHSRNVYPFRMEHEEQLARWTADAPEGMAVQMVADCLTAVEAVVVHGQPMNKANRNAILRNVHQALFHAMQERGYELTAAQMESLAGRFPVALTKDGTLLIGVHLTFAASVVQTVARAALNIPADAHFSKLRPALMSKDMAAMREILVPFFARLAIEAAEPMEGVRRVAFVGDFNAELSKPFWAESSANGFVTIHTAWGGGRNADGMVVVDVSDKEAPRPVLATTAQVVDYGLTQKIKLAEEAKAKAAADKAAGLTPVKREKLAKVIYAPPTGVPAIAAEFERSDAARGMFEDLYMSAKSTEATTKAAAASAAKAAADLAAAGIEIVERPPGGGSARLMSVARRRLRQEPASGASESAKVAKNDRGASASAPVAR
jgi:hypothetical protein